MLLLKARGEFTVSTFQHVRSHDSSIESAANTLRQGESEKREESYGYKRVTFDRAGDLSAPAMCDGSDRILPGSDNFERKETISRENPTDICRPFPPAVKIWR